VIEGVTFGDSQTWELLARHNVHALKADLTSDDAVGWPSLLEAEPSGGIPVTLIYAPGFEQPIKLTSIYSYADLKLILESINR
jgi:thiol:disulfide interchange protein